MSIHIDINGQLHHAGPGLSLTCPHCQVLAHMTPVSTPLWSVLRATRPTHVGVVYRCDACNEPVFIKYPVKLYAEQRIELSNHYTELEHARERFNFTHVPNTCETLFREALQCYSQGAYNAFASMCRRTAQAMIADMNAGESGSRLRLYDMLVEIRDLTGLDAESFQLVTRILLERTDPEPLLTQGGPQAGMLLEIMKDLLYQCYIRRGKLQKALRMRRYFDDERMQRNKPVTPLKVVP
jgi:hypothetical protein